MYRLYVLMLEIGDSEHVSLHNAMQMWLSRASRETILAVRQSAYDLIATIDYHLDRTDC